MPRNMSFKLTVEQIKNKTKTVTRRQGWYFLKPGDVVQPVEKSQGLKKGEKVKKIGGLIRIVSTRPEIICAIEAEDCIKEGFPDYRPRQFISMYCAANNVNPLDDCNRIEFEYVEDIYG